MCNADRPGTRLAICLVVALACGCAARQPSDAPPGGAAGTGAARAALLAADDALARALATQSPADAFGKFFTTDVVFGPPGEDLAMGKGEAVALVARPVVRDTRITLHRVGGAVSADGRTGYTFGWLLRTGAGGAATFGKYLAAWRLEAEGWRSDAFLWRPAKREPASPPPDASAGYQGSPAPGDVESLTRAVLGADAEFAALSLKKGYTVAFETFADPRAVCFTNGDFQWGSAGVKDVFAGWTPEEELSWIPRAGRAAASGDLGWTAGHAAMRVGSGSGATRSYMTYLTVWARQPDGTWRWLLDAGNSRPPPP